nr:118_t:CDS:2 [Entrophospora candida]
MIRTEVSKGIKFLFLVYIALSILYTINYFYTIYYPSNDTTSGTTQTGGIGFKTSSGWGKDKLSWKTHEGIYEYMSEEFFLSKVFGESMQPSHVIPYYFKAVSPPKEEDVTITTLITLDRFKVFDRLVTNYQGPISVTIHVNDDEKSREELISKLHELYHGNQYMKDYVDVHLVIDKFERQFNMWRNVAKFFARTNYVMMLDVDFHPCTDFRHGILNNEEIMAKLRKGNTALVVPAFEYANLQEGLDFRTFPTKKDEANEQIDSERLKMFHAVWKPGHWPTNYTYWQTAKEIYKVTTYQYQYEPYVIFPKNSVWCEERFVGYGANKAACLFELYISGVDYWVLPNDFLIHQTHEYLEDARKHERRFNRKLFDHFREEVCFRYARDFILNDEWDSDLTENLKKTCGKIRGFSKAVSYFVKSL